MLAGCLRKLEFFGRNATGGETLRGTGSAMDADLVAGLRTRISELESQLAAHASASGNGSRSVGVRSRMLLARGTGALRTIDTTIQAGLRGMSDPRWLVRYARWRGRLKTLLRRLV